MWIVRMALRHMHTFVVVALMIAVLGAVSAYRMSTDIFPSVNIPVVSVVWQYTGMPADQIETRIIFVNERVLTASVNGIEHIESQSLDGVGVIRIYFSARRAGRGRRGPGDGHLPDAAQGHAAGHHAAVHRPVQRHQRPHRADRRLQRHADRAADLRLRPELHHPAARHGPGRPRPPALRRQAAAGDGGAGQQPAVRPRPVAAGGSHGRPEPEPDHPGRAGQDRRHRVRRQAQQQPGRRAGVQLPARPDGQRRSGLRQGRGPRAGRASRCRPTSSAATAAGPC